MKPFIHLSIFLFILISQNSFSQTISSQKGLTTAVFNVSQNTITVKLPDDIRPGDLISGSVITMLHGSSAKQQRKAMDLLSKSKLSIGNTSLQQLSKATADQPLHFNKIIVAAPFIITVTDADNKTIQAEIKINSTTKNEKPAGCFIPGYVLMGAPLRVSGSFDGDASNTKCNVGGTAAGIIAESPRQCFVQVPSNTTGNNIEIIEKDQTGCNQNISAVRMTIEAPKLDLLKGEKTTVAVRITGLEGLKEPAKLNIDNISQEIVSMSGGNDQLIILNPDSLKGSDEFRKVLTVQSIQSGTYTINFHLDLPENDPPIFADVRQPAPGKKEESVITAGTRTALELGWKKVHDVEETKQGEDWDCPNCFQCIKSRVFSSNVNAVGELGWGIITSFLSGGLKLTGSVLNKIKDIADKGGDVYKALKEMIDKGEIQVSGFAEKWCDNNQYCQVSGIVVYYVKTGCVEARFKCVGSKMCCKNAETTYDLYYCLDKDGAVISDTVKMVIAH